MKIILVIIFGGVGMWFWLVLCELYLKLLFKLVDGESFFQKMFKWVILFLEVFEVVIVMNCEMYFLIWDECQEINDL